MSVGFDRLGSHPHTAVTIVALLAPLTVESNGHTPTATSTSTCDGLCSNNHCSNVQLPWWQLRIRTHVAVRLSQVERSLGAHGAQSTAGGGPRWYGFSYGGFFNEEGVLPVRHCMTLL